MKFNGLQQMKNRFSALRHQQRFRSGALAASLGAAVLVLVLLLNVLIGLLPLSFTEKDLTQIGLYSLSDYTKTYLSSLTEDVTVYVIAETGTEDFLVEQTLSRYADQSKHIRIQHVDPILKPTFAAQYTDQKLENGSLILVSAPHPDRPYLLQYSELGYRSYTEEERSYLLYIEAMQGEDARAYYEQVVGTTMYDAEKQITAGIDYVLSERLPQFYVIGGHGGKGLSAEFVSHFSMSNIGLQHLDLATLSELPADPDGLLLQAPETDLNPHEEALLRSYLAEGGTLLLTTSYDKLSNLPVLTALFAEYGLSGSSNVVIDPESCYRDWNSGTPSPTYLAPLCNSDHRFSESFRNKRLCVPIAHEIRQAETLPTGVTVTEVLRTTEHGACIDSQTQEKLAGSDGIKAVAVDAIKTEEAGKISRVIWFSSPYFLDSGANGYSGSNYDFFIQIASVLTGKNVDFPIAATAMETTELGMGETASIVLPIVLMAVIPTAVLVTGGIVCMRRRKR